MIQVCREHAGVFTWSKNIIVAYLVILLFVGRAFAGDYNDVCCVGCSDGLWDVLSPRRALQLAGEVTFCNQKNQLCLYFWAGFKSFSAAFKNIAYGVISHQWDVHALVQARERSPEGESRGPQLNAQGIAKMLVDQAREKRTKDNTSVIIIDFVSKCRPSFHTL